jgi:AraC-like DNA-binding protein
MIFTDGDENLTVNEHTMRVHKGVAVCSRPGEIWKWNPDTQLKALHLLFEEEFLQSFFNDSLFLDKFPYLQADRSSPFLMPDDELYERILHLYREMRDEINSPCSQKGQHLLRAMLYETLMLYNRVPHSSSDKITTDDMPVIRYVNQFRQLVEKEYVRQHDVEFYAERLCITSNYLNKIVKQTLGSNTKQYIIERLMAEAKRLLSYTSLSVAEIAEQLHFDTTTYFIRLFHRIEGVTPNQFRNRK